MLYKGTHAAAQTPSPAFVAPTPLSAKRRKTLPEHERCETVAATWEWAGSQKHMNWHVWVWLSAKQFYSDLNRAQTSGNEGGVGDCAFECGIILFNH